MLRAAKIAAYRAARMAGLFRVARRLTRNRTRILGYHGFALHDEAQFRAKLFIKPDTFARRLDYLRRAGYRVVTLDQALDEMRSGRSQPDTVVITIDDGFATTLSVAAPMLHAHRFNATVYLTTYYMQKQQPVFDLIVGYMVWKSDTRAAGFVDPSSGTRTRLDLSSPGAKERAASLVLESGRRCESEAQRVALCRELGQALGVDYDAIVAAGSFRLMSFEEARRLRTLGVDVGLHTHRHTFPASDPSACRNEIEQNRRILKEELGVNARHFCYPSGVYSPVSWPLLAELGVASATTCDTGLARADEEPLGLRRFLDGEMVSEIEFEAELSGFSELLRRSLSIDRASAAR
jgi:peptidoglycan/xylan/chitin deacetylase (PgdA/CDA1 family)